jgi:CubicO group peptidase (beta-lactamase class C family)
LLGGCSQRPAKPPPTPGPSTDQRVGEQLSHRLQELLDGLVQEQLKVRSGLLLVEGPGFFWQGASGIAFERTGSAALPEDQFAIDSVAKSLTATIVMRLVEDGRLALDDPIVQYLPRALTDGLHVSEGRAYTKDITIRHLLNHSSGIEDDWRCPGFLDLVAADLDRRWTPEETVEYVKDHCTPRFPPGAGFWYSDTGYNLLGLIVERVTSMPLHRVFRELLLGPLGMNHTYRPAYEAARPSIPGRAPSERFLGDIECSLAPAVMTADWGGGGLISTTHDLNRFLRAFVDNRVFRNAGTRDEMLHWVDSGPFHGYGFGIGLVDFERSENPEHAGLGEIWGHAGSSQVFMYYWPRRDVTMIGTLNQIESDRSLYDIVASIMIAVRDVV